MVREAPTNDRPIPLSFNRAATAIVHCRKLLESADDDTRLAMTVLANLEDANIEVALDPMEVMTRLRRLGEVLVLLEESQRALAGAWPVTWDSVDASASAVR